MIRIRVLWAYCAQLEYGCEDAFGDIIAWIAIADG